MVRAYVHRTKDQFAPIQKAIKTLRANWERL